MSYAGRATGFCHQSSEGQDARLQARSICQKAFEQNGCEGLKASLAAEDKKKIVDCSSISELQTVEPLYECGTDVVIGLFWPVFVPVVIHGALKADEECFNDIPKKIKMMSDYNLIANSYLDILPQSELQIAERTKQVKIPDEMILAYSKLSCTEVRNLVERKNKNLISLKAELMRRKLWKPEANASSPLAEAVKKLADRLKLKLDCYRTEYKVAAMCGLLGGAAASVGMKAAIRTAEKNVIRRELGIELSESAVDRAIFVGENPQIRLWKLQEAGEVQSAKRLEDRLRDALENDEFKVIRETERGMNVPVIVETSSGVKAIWKRAHNGNPNAEVAASTIDQMIGSNWVPMVVKRKLNGEPGTLHLFVEGKHLDDIPLNKRPEIFSYFDYLIRQIDRNNENFLVVNGRPVAIDHGAALLSKQEKDFFTGKKFDPLGAKGLDYPKFLDREIQAYKTAASSEEKMRILQKLKMLVPEKNVYQRLVEVPDAQWRQVLGPELTPEQLNLFFDQRNKIIKSIERAKTEIGNDVFRDGPASPIFDRTSRQPRN